MARHGAMVHGCQDSPGKTAHQGSVHEQKWVKVLRTAGRVQGVDKPQNAL